MHVCETDIVQIMLLGGSGGMPPPRKLSCPETESGEFWQLADYPTLVFKITAF